MKPLLHVKGAGTIVTSFRALNCGFCIAKGVQGMTPMFLLVTRYILLALVASNEIKNIVNLCW